MVDPQNEGLDGNRGGFTLVEILVAFAILALSLAAVMQALSGGLRLLSASEAHAEAVRLAESRLAEAGRAVPLAPSASSGSEGRYRWRRDITLYDDEDPAVPAPRAHEVTVTVIWGGNRSLTLSTVELGRPADG